MEGGWDGGDEFEDDAEVRQLENQLRKITTERSLKEREDRRQKRLKKLREELRELGEKPCV